MDMKEGTTVLSKPQPDNLDITQDPEKLLAK
jgi:hypothetical protein